MTDMLHMVSEDPIRRILGRLFVLTGANEFQINQEVARSEYETADRNRALGHYLKSHGNLYQAVEDVLWTYCQICAIEANCSSLAKLASVLAKGGGRYDGQPVLTASQARCLSAIVQLCGLYGHSTDHYVRTGLSAKSGSGGGIIAALPDVVSSQSGLRHWVQAAIRLPG